jgi:hypothetical protein
MNEALAVKNQCPCSRTMSASLEIASKDYGRGGVGVKKNPTGGKNMQESRMASAAGNGTAGREFTSPSPPRSSLCSDQTALANIRSHAEQDRHWCRPPSTPMLNRFYLFYISLCSLLLSSIYLWAIYGTGGWAASLHHPPCHRHSSPPISHLQRWTAPWSPRWPIARRRPPKASPAKDLSNPVPPPVCQQSWWSGSESRAGAGSE